MNEILDKSNEQFSIKPGFFSKISFLIAGITTAGMLFSLFIVSSLLEELSYSLLDRISLYTTLSIFIGGVATLISVNRKEPNHWIKWTSAAINTMWFAFYIVFL